MKETINQLKKEIEKWTYPHKDRSDKPSRVQDTYDYKRELLEAKLKTLQEVCEEIKVIQKQLVKNSAPYQVCKELLKKFQGEELTK